MATYLYAIVLWPMVAPPGDGGGRGGGRAKGKRVKAQGASPDAALGAGVGEEPRAVEPVVHRDLAALVSETAAEEEVGGDDVRALRRDMKPHSAVLNRLVELGAASVLPEMLNHEAGDVMRFDCVGPPPPYSFAELRL